MSLIVFTASIKVSCKSSPILYDRCNEKKLSNNFVAFILQCNQFFLLLLLCRLNKMPHTKEYDVHGRNHPWVWKFPYQLISQGKVNKAKYFLSWIKNKQLGSFEISVSITVSKNPLLQLSAQITCCIRFSNILNYSLHNVFRTWDTFQTTGHFVIKHDWYDLLKKVQVSWCHHGVYFVVPLPMTALDANKHLSGKLVFLNLLVLHKFVITPDKKTTTALFCDLCA